MLVPLFTCLSDTETVTWSSYLHIREESKKKRYLHEKEQHIHKCQDSHECNNGLLRENVHFLILAYSHEAHKIFSSIYHIADFVFWSRYNTLVPEVNFGKLFSPIDTCHIYYQNESRKLKVCLDVNFEAIIQIMGLPFTWQGGVFNSDY